MIKEVELRKLNGKTQYVDWESGEELYKRSDCIPLVAIDDLIKEIEKDLSKEDMNSHESSKLIYELDFCNKLKKGL